MAVTETQDDLAKAYTAQSSNESQEDLEKEYAKQSAQPSAPETPDTGSWWDKAKRYGTSLAQSVGLPTTTEEAKAAAEPSAAEILLGPAANAAESAYGYVKNVGRAAKESGKEALEAGENIGEGAPVSSQMGKFGYALVHPVMQAIPFVGPSTERAGEQVTAKDYAGAAGSITGAAIQALPMVEGLGRIGQPKLVGPEYIPDNIRSSAISERMPAPSNGRVRAAYVEPTSSATEPELVGNEHTEGQTPAGQAKPGAPRIEYAEPTPNAPKTESELVGSEHTEGQSKPAPVKAQTGIGRVGYAEPTTFTAREPGLVGNEHTERGMPRIEPVENEPGNKEVTPEQLQDILNETGRVLWAEP